MATLTELVKTETYKKLSKEEEKDLTKLKKNSIDNYTFLKNILDTIGKQLNDTCIRKDDAAEDIRDLQEGIYESLFQKFARSINNYNDYIVKIKRSGYYIPNLEKTVPSIGLKSSETTFNMGGYYYRKTKTLNKKIITIDNNSWVVKFNDYKKFDYKYLVNVMEKLGFVIMPLEFLSDEAYKVDKEFSSDQIKGKIESFKIAIRNIDNSFNYYILAPIKYLDLMKWAKCKDINKTVTFASSLGNLSLNINMNMPLFRSIFGTMEILEKRVSNVEGRVSELEKELEQVKSQQKLINDNVNMLQTQLNTFKTEMVQKVESLIASQGELNTRVESLEKWRIACMTDPLIFAKNRDTCYVGFAWGPEFSEDVLEEFNIPIYR